MAERVIRDGEWLEGRTVRLRLVTLDDCNARYLAWLADREVNRYLETRFVEQTLEMIRAFVRGTNASLHSYLFAIVQRSTGDHIGNIKLGPTNERHSFGDVSYFVGERAAWGKGLATDAVCVATAFGFERLGLHRIQAGFYETNVGSQRVLEKAGFVAEGRNLKKLRQNAESPWEDHLWYSAFQGAWERPDAYRLG